MKNIFISLRTIFTSIKNKKYDVVFAYPNHFNRGNDGENLLLKPFIDICHTHNINYLLIEETDLKGAFSQFPRNSNAFFLDFVILIKILMKKLGMTNQKIYSFLKLYIFSGFKAKVYITLAHSNVDLWRYINPDAIIADYQHGMIWYGDGKKTPYRSIPSPDTRDNNVISLVYGDSYKDILVKYDQSHFHNDENVISIGFYRSLNQYKLKKNKKNILWSMQNVDMKTNKPYYDMIEKILEKNKEYLISNNYHIYFKNHPRYDKLDPLIFSKNYNFVSFLKDEDTINNSLTKVELHITSKSTTAFDASLNSIPTIFINILKIRSPRDIFLEQYKYPLLDLIVDKENDLKIILERLENNFVYENYSLKAFNWSKSFYQDFDEKIFLSLLGKDNK